MSTVFLFDIPSDLWLNESNVFSANLLNSVCAALCFCLFICLLIAVIFMLLRRNKDVYNWARYSSTKRNQSLIPNQGLDRTRVIKYHTLKYVRIVKKIKYAYDTRIITQVGKNASLRTRSRRPTVFCRCVMCYISKAASLHSAVT